VGLTGTKIGGDRSECGTCPVFVDDVPQYRQVLTALLRGAEHMWRRNDG
jgi:aerobic-type carbon monoxide dehydrogenase small subunit (CoxS/CutS family)